MEVLKNVLLDVYYFVCQFDESYNDILKKGQMNLHGRYWDSTTNTVTAAYWSSEFLSKAAFKDLFKNFKECISGYLV